MQEKRNSIANALNLRLSCTKPSLWSVFYLQWFAQIRTWISCCNYSFAFDAITRPWASYHIRIIAGCACAGNARNVFPATAGKRSRHASGHVCDARANYQFPLKLVSGGNVFGIPAHAQLVILRIWQEAHAIYSTTAKVKGVGDWLHSIAC